MAEHNGLTSVNSKLATNSRMTSVDAALKQACAKFGII